MCLKWREVRYFSKPFYLIKVVYLNYFFAKLLFVINVLNYKTVIVLKLLQYRQNIKNCAISKLLFVTNVLNYKTVIVPKLVQYCLILANSACGLVGYLSGDIALAFAL